MKFRAPSKRLRLFAAATLAAWIGALFLCAMESRIGHGHSGETDEHHADAESATHSHGEHDDDAPSKPHEGGFCGALKSTTMSSVQAGLLKPNLACIGLLSSPFLCSSASVETFDPLPLRQAKRAIGVFTPVVCTAPANRSHAPPVFS